MEGGRDSTGQACLNQPRRGRWLAAGCLVVSSLLSFCFLAAGGWRCPSAFALLLLFPRRRWISKCDPRWIGRISAKITRSTAKI